MPRKQLIKPRQLHDRRDFESVAVQAMDTLNGPCTRYEIEDGDNTRVRAQKNKIQGAIEGVLEAYISARLHVRHYTMDDVHKCEKGLRALLGPHECRIVVAEIRKHVDRAISVRCGKGH